MCCMCVVCVLYVNNQHAYLLLGELQRMSDERFLVRRQVLLVVEPPECYRMFKYKKVCDH